MSEQRPRGPIAWFRRTGLSALARLFALAGLLVVALWGAGRYFNDDHLWSQILFWVPPALVAVLAWVALVCSAACSRLSLRMGGVKLRPFLAVGAIVVTVWTVHSWRPLNVLKALAPRSERGLTVAYWNISVEHDAAGAGDIILAQQPDIAIMANIRHDEHRQPMLETLGTLVPEDGEGVHFRHDVNITVSGRFPIRRTGMARPQRVTTRLTEWRSEWDTGRITFIEFELTGPARERFGFDTFVVWVVDLPSDPTMHRAEVMDAAARAVRTYQGPARAPDHLGRWGPAELPEGQTGFPEPDLIIGDFNTPRGSRSLRALVGDATSTHTQAGLGPAGTWMRSLPLWAIDQAFTGERVRAVRSRVIDPGMSEHRMLVVELDRR